MRKFFKKFRERWDRLRHRYTHAQFWGSYEYRGLTFTVVDHPYYQSGLIAAFLGVNVSIVKRYFRRLKEKHLC